VISKVEATRRVHRERSRQRFCEANFCVACRPDLRKESSCPLPKDAIFNKTLRRFMAVLCALFSHTKKLAVWTCSSTIPDTVTFLRPQ
jgi:hypothetical protein